MMFLDNFWDCECDYIKEKMGTFGSSFKILSITKDDIKRIVNIDFEIADYECFKNILKHFKEGLNQRPSNPYYAVQYKHNVVTLFVKSQEEIYELEDYDFSDVEFLKKRRKETYRAFCSKQLNYWGIKEQKAERLLDKLKKERWERLDDLKEYEKELENLKSIVDCMHENCQWYFGKLCELDEGVVPF